MKTVRYEAYRINLIGVICVHVDLLVLLSSNLFIEFRLITRRRIFINIDQKTRFFFITPMNKKILFSGIVHVSQFVKSSLIF